MELFVGVRRGSQICSQSPSRRDWLDETSRCCDVMSRRRLCTFVGRDCLVQSIHECLAVASGDVIQPRDERQLWIVTLRLMGVCDNASSLELQYILHSSKPGCCFDIKVVERHS